MIKYADVVINEIDPQRVIKYRFYRNHCKIYNSILTKDLTIFQKNLKNVIIIDNSPKSYIMNPDNALPIVTWINNKSDKELEMLAPILEGLAKKDDVRKYISQMVLNNILNYSKAMRLLYDSNEKFYNQFYTPVKNNNGYLPKSENLHLQTNFENKISRLKNSEAKNFSCKNVIVNNDNYHAKICRNDFDPLFPLNYPKTIYESNFISSMNNHIPICENYFDEIKDNAKRYKTPNKFFDNLKQHPINKMPHRVISSKISANNFIFNNSNKIKENENKILTQTYGFSDSNQLNTKLNELVISDKPTEIKKRNSYFKQLDSNHHSNYLDIYHQETKPPFFNNFVRNENLKINPTMQNEKNQKITSKN